MPWSLVVVFALGLCVACQPTGHTGALPPSDIDETASLAPGDVVVIRVADHEELTGEYQVSDDGTLNFPHIGLVAAAGKTAGALARDLENGLADGYINHPHVSIVVKSRQNREVQVLGQVKNPGSFPFQEGLTLVQAISNAGGLTPLARLKKVKVSRRTTQGTRTFEIDLREIVDGKREDISLAPGDTVYVEESPI